LICRAVKWWAQADGEERSLDCAPFVPLRASGMTAKDAGHGEMQRAGKMPSFLRLRKATATAKDEGNYAGRMPALRNANGAKEVSYI